MPAFAATKPRRLVIRGGSHDDPAALRTPLHMRLRSHLSCGHAWVLLVLLAGAGLAFGAPGPAATADVHGLWIDHTVSDKQKVAVWIEDCGDRLCGSIYWLRKPLSASGEPKRDQHNPDASLRERPLCGLTILSGFLPPRGHASSAGRIYDPSDGSLYSSTLTLTKDGRLSIRGYVGIPLLGKTVEWVRPQQSLKRCE